MDPFNKRFAVVDNANRAVYLISGFISRTLTIEEREELDAWVLASEDNMQIFEDMTDEPMIDPFMKWATDKS